MIAKGSTVAPLKLGPESAGLLLSPLEFDSIEEYDENYRYELIEGVLVVNPIPSEGESGPNELLGGLLYAYKAYHPQGAALDKTLQERYVRVANGRRRADRVIWAGLGRTPVFALDVPTIAIEYVSRSRRDRDRDYVVKREEYLRTGMKEYWLIDRFQRLMSVFRFKGGKVKALKITENEVYRTPLLPGFELPLAPLLAEADECSQE